MAQDEHGSDTRSGIDRRAIVDDLRALGLREGDVVLVHSSLSGLGWVEGGAETVIDALVEAVGPGGTVLFPTLTGTEHDGPEHPPIIELMATPCWTGRVPETARRRPEAMRSVHPTHSVSAIGARAADFTTGHEASRTPCDQHSPYVRLMEEGGKILLLGGVTHESNTTLHALEEMAERPVSPAGRRDGRRRDPAGWQAGRGAKSTASVAMGSRVLEGRDVSREAPARQ